MKCRSDGQAASRNARTTQMFERLSNSGRGARQHDLLRTVIVGDNDGERPLREERSNRVAAGSDRGHRALPLRGRLHKLTATPGGCDQRCRIEDAGGAQCGQLAAAVTRDRIGREANGP